jgi:hypothetical protein
MQDPCRYFSCSRSFSCNRRLLIQLVDRLGFLDDIDPENPLSKSDSELWKAYKQHETGIFVLASGEDVPASIKTMQTVYK